MIFMINNLWFPAILWIQLCYSARHNHEQNPLIVGGVDVSIEQYPHVAQILWNQELQCGGSIISNKVILTAAHCIVDERGTIDPKVLDVYLGSSYLARGARYKACLVKTHPKYEDYRKTLYSYFYDLGLIILKTQIKFGPTVKIVKIAPNNKWKTRASMMTLAGFGLTENRTLSKKLRMTRMFLVDSYTCNMTQTSTGQEMPVPNHMFCMIGSRTTSDCSGDSGSGVIWQKYIVGLVVIGRDSDCGSVMLPSMYTDVTYFRDWINATMKQFNRCTYQENGFSKLFTKNKEKIHSTTNLEWISSFIP